ncbi:unnamed protein product, partial [Effrenium voratum]
MQQRLTGENAQLRQQLQSLQQEAESRRQSWREKEAELLRQVEQAAAKLEALSAELGPCQAVQQDLERRLREASKSQQEREESFKVHLTSIDTEAVAMKAKVQRLEADRAEQ